MRLQCCRAVSRISDVDSSSVQVIRSGRRRRDAGVGAGVAAVGRRRSPEPAAVVRSRAAFEYKTRPGARRPFSPVGYGVASRRVAQRRDVAYECEFESRRRWRAVDCPGLLLLLVTARRLLQLLLHIYL